MIGKFSSWKISKKGLLLLIYSKFSKCQFHQPYGAKRKCTSSHLLAPTSPLRQTRKYAQLLRCTPWTISSALTNPLKQKLPVERWWNRPHVTREVLRSRAWTQSSFIISSLADQTIYNLVIEIFSLDFGERLVK